MPLLPLGLSRDFRSSKMSPKRDPPPPRTQPNSQLATRGLTSHLTHQRERIPLRVIQEDHPQIMIRELGYQVRLIDE